MIFYDQAADFFFLYKIQVSAEKVIFSKNYTQAVTFLLFLFMIFGPTFFGHRHSTEYAFAIVTYVNIQHSTRVRTSYDYRASNKYKVIKYSRYSGITFFPTKKAQPHQQHFSEDYLTGYSLILSSSRYLIFTQKLPIRVSFNDSPGCVFFS